MANAADSDDFEIPLPPSWASEVCTALDEAIDVAAAELGLPLLGGPSGRGWSFFSEAAQCPHRFKRLRDVETAKGAPVSTVKPAHYLQIGGLYHALEAYYDAGDCDLLLYEDRGLRVPTLEDDPTKLVSIDTRAAERLLHVLGQMARGDHPSGLIPSLDFIEVAQDCWDRHTSYYGNGREDVEILAIEWLARHPTLRYTCRYDRVARLGEHDPLIKESHLRAGDTVVFERKTAAWLSEMALNWVLEGEVIGEVLNWEPSGCAERFGPLAAVVVDVVAKKKPAKGKHEFERIVVPSEAVAVRDHTRLIQYYEGQISMWRASGYYPKNWTQCFSRWGQCPFYDDCTIEGMQGAK